VRERVAKIRSSVARAVPRNLGGLFLVFLALLVSLPAVLDAQVRVRGYYRKDGTYVRPHVRTRPDGNPYNNYSFPGNYNPNTGRITPGDPAAYLRNYYGRSRTTTRNRTKDTRSAVSALQLSLKALGHHPGSIDGVLGAGTKSAISSFQESSGLSMTGTADAPTIDSLIEALKALSDGTIEDTANRAGVQLMPENAHLDSWGSDWVCNRGYRKSGSRCVPVAVPENAKLDYWGRDWVCRRGFSRVGSNCEPVAIPSNARLDSWGHDWVCNRGYRKSGSQCVPVAVPENAKLDY